MMTDAQFVKSFSKMIIALTILTLILIALGVAVGGSIDDKLQAQTEEYTQQIIAQRTEPVGNLNVGELADQGVAVAMSNSTNDQTVSIDSETIEQGIEAAAAHPGKGAYSQNCYICHDAGVTGAPKPGDVENWQPRIQKGIEVLYGNAINGYQGENGIMPPKGGNLSLSDEEVKAAVDYLVALVE